jgi:hypothetical protein
VDVELELSRGEFLVPVLIRAVRAVGVQCGLDLDRLADASVAVEAVALAWAGDGATPGDGDEPLRVRIARAGPAMEISFRFAASADAGRLRRASLIPGADGLDALAAEVAVESTVDGSRLVLSLRP